MLYVAFKSYPFNWN